MNLSVTNQVSQVKPLFTYLRKQRENKRFMHSLEITATFILISFFLFFAIRPTALTISSLVGDIKAKQILKTQLKTKINNIVNAQTAFSQIQERYQIINDSLPDQPQFFQAANQIQKTGNNSGQNLSSLEFGFQNNKENINPNTKQYSVSLNIDGEFSSALKLVSDLLKNRRLINISSIDIGSSDPAKSAVSTNFITNFYYWSPVNEKK